MVRKLIHSTPTYQSIFGHIPIVLLLALLVVEFSETSAGVKLLQTPASVSGLIVACSALYVLGVLLVVYIKRQPLTQRKTQIAELAKRNGYVYELSYKKNICSKNFAAIKQYETTTKNVLTAKDWTYGDVSYGLAYGVGRSKYIPKNLHYSVVKLPLSKEYPNVLFDSMDVHGKQFARALDPIQICHTGTEMDTHYTTYLPEQHHENAHRLISADLQQAVLATHPADVEIHNNTLYIYSARLSPEEIPNFVQVALRVKDTLIDNATQYNTKPRNEQQARTAKTDSTAFVQRNIFPWHIIAISATVLWGVSQTFVASSFYRVLVFALSWGAIATHSMLRWHSKEQTREAERQRQLHKTNNE